MATSGERVVCTVCSEKIILKNLKTHYGRQHPGVSVKYKSATSGNISAFFSIDGSTAKKKKTNESDETNVVDKARPSTSAETGDGHTSSASCDLFDSGQIQKLLEKVNGE